MLSEPIFHRDAKGKIRQWRYEVEGDRWRTHSGLTDGEQVASGWTVCTPKSRDTAEEQALFEAQAEEKKKLDRKYAKTVADLDVPKAAGVRPMLAHKFETWKGPCFVQPKLDGIRCLATKDGLWSRTGQPLVACPHISESLSPWFERFPDHVLDGELYNHDLRDDFNSITSIVKKTKPSEADLAKAAEAIQYHVYDLAVGTWKFSERMSFLENSFQFEDCILAVETRRAETIEELDAHYAEFLEHGFEGQMVRFDGPYEQKRSKLLLKRKEFFDAEFEFMRVEEGNGNWGGIPKRAILRLPDGRDFGAGIKGSVEFCKSLVGKQFTQVTVRYFALTPDGVPRFPVAVAFHEGERF